MREPAWLDRVIEEAIHHDQLQQHGGLRGIKDENALESALARARHRWAYRPRANLFELAAAYGYGLATEQAYSDGNKRVAFMAMYVFLGLNGHDIEAPEAEVVQLMRAVAAGETKERALAAWLRAHATAIER